MAPEPCKENRFQRFMRGDVWPIWQRHPFVLIFGLWVFYILGTFLDILLLDANVVVLCLVAGIWLVGYSSFFYSSSCHERFCRHEARDEDE